MGHIATGLESKILWLHTQFILLGIISGSRMTRRDTFPNRAHTIVQSERNGSNNTTFSKCTQHMMSEVYVAGSLSCQSCSASLGLAASTAP